MMPKKERNMEVTKVPANALDDKHYTPAEKAEAQAKIIAYAKAYVGTREIGYSNTGPEVSRWLTQAGCAPGNSWCMAFAYSMFLENGYITVNGKKLLKQTAGCQDQADYARSIGTLVAARECEDQLKAGLPHAAI